MQSFAVDGLHVRRRRRRRWRRRRPHRGWMRRGCVATPRERRLILKYFVVQVGGHRDGAGAAHASRVSGRVAATRVTVQRTGSTSARCCLPSVASPPRPRGVTSQACSWENSPPPFPPRQNETTPLPYANWQPSIKHKAPLFLTLLTSSIVYYYYYFENFFSCQKKK